MFNCLIFKYFKRYKKFLNANKAINKKYSLLHSSLSSLLFVIFILETVHCDVFNSQEELDSLLHLQLRVGNSLREYVKNEELIIQELQLSLKRFENIEKYSYKEKLLQNPVNAFVVLKTLAKDLNTFLMSAGSQVRNYEDLIQTVNELRNIEGFPNDEDVKGAALAINRLQDTYKFEVSRMVEGFLGAHCCSLKLEASEFFELGKQSFISKDYPHTVDWMNQVLTILNNGKNNSTEMETGETVEIKKMKIEATDFLYGAQQIQNTIELAKDFFTSSTGIEFDSLLDQISIEISGDVLVQAEDGKLQGHYSIKSRYEALCRGESKVLVDPQLRCTYSTRRNKYLFLTPIKEEIVNLSPLIYLFHDVLHDKEIELIKQLAQPKFETATVSNHLTGSSKPSTVRVGKTAWIREDENPQMAKINERIGILTQLDLESAEDLQVANYGIGGHYEPHYDFSYGGHLISNLNPKEGNRIATFMFYMSDVEAGGGTVFPNLNIAVRPTKGSALFWHNMHENGDVDFRTKHAACPVLLGSKWVSNKWLHERGQEFKRPCKEVFQKQG